MKLRPTPPAQTLEEKIRAKEAERYIDQKAEELKEQHEGVPVTVIRNLLTNRTFGCSCQAALNIMEQN